MKEAFERGMVNASASDPVIASAARYLYFDFHTECKGMRFDRVSVLVDRLAGSLQDMGFYHAVGETRIASTQTGVIRSNCMDCLDRTNVMQSALGKWTLDRQLRAAGVLSLKETLGDHAEFMNIFRNGKSILINSTPRKANLLLNMDPSVNAHVFVVWADHGDTVSRAYAGTGALKTDYTRTGKRSKQGQLQDGYNSIMRYIRNNFFDGDRQVRYISFSHSSVQTFV